MWISRILLFILFFSILYLIKEGFSFFIAFKKGEPDMTTPRLFGIAAALSYILTIIFTGI